MSSTSSTGTSTSTSVTASGASFSALGIGSGLDLQSIITSLVTEYSQPKTALQTALAAHQATVSQYQALNTGFATIKTAAQALSDGYDWQAKTASSSDSATTASATSAAVAGSLSFQVNSLATSESAASYGYVASTDTVVGTGNLLLGATGNLGIGNITGSGLSLGSHTLAVTQASSGAQAKGTSLGDSITLTGTETLNATIDGTAKSFTLTAGTYNQQTLAAMVSKVSAGGLNVTVNSDKSLEVATTHEGSTATMAITGGSGLAALGLATTSSTNGTNGIVTVDGVANTITSIKPDGSNSVTLNGSAGTIAANFDGGLRVGTSTLANIDLGDGKLSTVVNAINNSGAGVAAAAVAVGNNQYKLQLQSSTSGTAGQISTNFNAFHNTLGDIGVVNAGTDAQLQIGTGANAYTITSSSNSISNILPGVTVNITAADPAKTVTINVTGDVKGMETKVKALIDSVNSSLSYITTNSTYDPTSKTAGALLGNFQAQSLQQGLASAMNQAFPSSDLNSLSAIGITSNDDGTYAFDTSKFESAYSSDPEGVAGLFVDGGSKGTTMTGHPGLAEGLLSLANNATDSVSGSITTALSGENTSISDLNTQIADWTTRITAYQDQLIQQYSASDTAVANLKSQQTYLTGQITALSANG